MRLRPEQICPLSNFDCWQMSVNILKLTDEEMAVYTRLRTAAANGTLVPNFFDMSYDDDSNKWFGLYLWLYPNSNTRRMFSMYHLAPADTTKTELVRYESEYINMCELMFIKGIAVMF